MRHSWWGRSEFWLWEGRTLGATDILSGSPWTSLSAWSWRRGLQEVAERSPSLRDVGYRARYSHLLSFLSSSSLLKLIPSWYQDYSWYLRILTLQVHYSSAFLKMCRPFQSQGLVWSHWNFAFNRIAHLPPREAINLLQSVNQGTQWSSYSPWPSEHPGGWSCT